MGFLGELGKQVRELYGRLTASQKIAFTLLVALVVVAMVALTTWGGREDYVALTAQPADATEKATALERLRQAGITVRESGSVIQVGQNELSRAMAVLAESGSLPTDFSRMQRTTSNSNSIFKTSEDSRYDRDVQLAEFLGEVIRHMDGIKMAKVVFDVPTAYETLDGNRKGTSSVVVWLKDKGAALNGQQVDGIAALITGALRDIPRENVRIVDGQGRAYRVRGGDTMTAAVSDRHEQELAYEAQLAKKVQDLLSYLGEVKVTVRATIDFSQKSIQERHVDPNTVEISSTNKKTTSEPVEATEKRTEQERTVKNDVSTKVTNLTEAPGKVTDLSVSALVPREGVITQLRSEGVEVSEKATAEELSPGLEKIKACIANALGMTDTSKVVVDAVSFPRLVAAEMPAPVAAAAKSDAMATYGTSAVLGAFVLAAMFMLWRMMKRPVRVSLDERNGSALGLATGDEALLGNLNGLDAETVRRSRMEERVKSMVTENPEEAAKLVTRWVRAE